MSLYLDNAATTKPVDSILETIKPYIEDEWYNPSAKYSGSQRVREKIEQVRSDVAKSINANSNEIYFTSGASESNNWAIRGFMDEHDGAIISTMIEHSSILNLLKNKKRDFNVRICDISTNYGYVDENYLVALLKCLKIDVSVLVSIQFANNEIGTIQDIKTISEIVHEHNAILHVDATQAYGHIPINVKELDIDMMSASAQKCGGIKGTGFLYIKQGINIAPLIYGEQERSMRGGTENVIGIVALGEAVKKFNYENISNMICIRNKLIEQLEGIGCKLNGSRSRLPNNINVTLPNKLTGEALIYLMDASGIQISAGSACNSNSQEISHVLKAIGLTEDEALRTIRITLPDDITEEQILYFMDELKKSIKILEIN